MDEVYQYLEKFYNKLYDNLLLSKKVRNKSILFSFLNIKSNDRFRLLDNSSISGLKIPQDVLLQLQNNNFIRGTNNRDEYTITAAGICEIEEQKHILSEATIVEFLDGKFFDLFKGDKPLTDKEKIILLSMIAARTYSEQSVVDLKKNELTMDAWKEILDNAHKELSELKVISLGYAKLYGKSGNEHPVSHLIRHTDALPKKTKGLFKAIGKQQYYIDLYQDSEISQRDLSYSFWLIFKGKLDPNEVEAILAFCTSVAYNKNIYVFARAR